MAPAILFLSTFILFATINSTLATGRLLGSNPNDPSIMRFQYHNGPLLAGNLSLNLIWYGPFTPAHRAIVSDFVSSLSGSSPNPTTSPSVSSWWASVSKYHRLASPTRPARLSVKLGSQLLDDKYSAGKSLSADQLRSLAAKAQSVGSISVVLTGPDVAVDGFCMNRCGTHGSVSGRGARAPFIWVGNSVTQCPGLCAWPFHQPIYGPQGPPLVAPNGDVGMDGVVMNLAGLLAGTVTNPFGNGYFQGPKDAPLEAASACPGVYGKGAYPGYAGDLLVDPASGASYNANGVNGRKYLLPGLFDPATQSCSTLV